MIVYRVQCAFGRGPYRTDIPNWKDPGHDYMNPSIYEEFGFEIMDKFIKGFHHGCGFKKPCDLRMWFTHTEMTTLLALGYQIVSMNADKIIAESSKQVVFSRKLPFKKKVKVYEYERFAEL